MNTRFLNLIQWACAPKTLVRYVLSLVIMKTALAVSIASAQVGTAPADPVPSFGGTSIGGGAPDVVDSIVELLRQQMQSQIVSFPGSNGDTITMLAGWCNRVATTLEMALSYSDSRINHFDDKPGAEQVLVQALELIDESLSLPPTGDGPIGKKLVRRALDIHAALSTVNPLETSPIEIEARIGFLRSYIRFTIEEVLSFDRNFYIPYLYRSTAPCYARRGVRCPDPFNIMAFEIAFLRFVEHQLQFVIGPEVIITPGISGVPAAIPAWDERASLRIAEHVSAQTVIDLTQDSLFANRFHCAAMRLGNLSQMLAAYNQGSGLTTLLSGRRALLEIVGEFRRAQNRLQEITCP